MEALTLEEVHSVRHARLDLDDDTMAVAPRVANVAANDVSAPWVPQASGRHKSRACGH